MKTLTAIPLSELIKKAGSKRRVAQIAGIQNLGSLSHESVLIGDRMYRPSISTADWVKVSKELVGSQYCCASAHADIRISGVCRSKRCFA